MEERKQKEIEFYDKQAYKGSGDFEGFLPQNLSSYKFLYNFIKDKCRDKRILDYGCGNGIHSVFLAKCAGNVTAIDLSENQLQIARKIAEREEGGIKIDFLKMDCEKLEFPDKFFDIIFDGGTFSSLDLGKSYLELARVLKNDGFLIGIETFGHNPFTNLKRKINKLVGKRTGWASEHIFQVKNLEEARTYFDKIEVEYFHLISWAAFPFLRFPGGKYLLEFFEIVDGVLLKLPFLKKYAFKVVFILSQPKNND
ncbi:MAG: class I SAM-dependent methyltransferase [Patescibacteria group bacterium]